VENNGGKGRKNEEEEGKKGRRKERELKKRRMPDSIEAKLLDLRCASVHGSPSLI
jgi:hypothetical protein